MNIIPICIFAVIGLALSLVLIFLCFPKKMQAGPKAILGVISAVVYIVLFGIFGFCISFKLSVMSIIDQGFNIISSQASELYPEIPDIMEKQFSTNELTGILEKINVGSKIDEAVSGFGPLERTVVKRLIMSVFPVVYGVDSVSGSLQGLITDDMRATGTTSISQILDVVKLKISGSLQKVLFIIQIVVIVLFAFYTILVIVVSKYYTEDSKKGNKHITFGEGLDS